ncbi:MAG: PD-(D/E)XK nuclease family protein [Treponema sp.]
MRIITEYSSIAEYICRYGKDAKTCFVFPSKIASRLWMHRSLDLTGLQAVPAEQFSAWDTFKAECCIAQTAHRSPATQLTRLLFAYHIAEANAAADTPFLQNIIPPDYAADGSIFAQWIAGILPQLDHWEKCTLLHRQAGSESAPETADLRFLKKAYTDFLAEHQLFEPSWAGTEFVPHGKQYILFYPELMEDFDEYAGLLHNRPEIAALPAPPFNGAQTPLVHFTTMRQEIRSVVLAVEQLLIAGVPADEIALSIAGIDEAVPYLKREFALRSIPAEFRLGFKLGEQQAGRLFPLLQTCVQEQYSFESLKPLLLNPHIPWKHPEHIQSLINFGIKNNCLVSWKDGGRYKNVWLEAFKLPLPYNPRNSFEAEEAERAQAREWFIPFMKAAERLVNAKSFSDIQRQYILFREQYLDAGGFSDQDNAVIGRCITLLQELVQLEATFADCMPKRPYAFFTAQLSREIYVPQNTGRAVSIFPFRVAAAIPCAHHFVLNCNQKASRVIYQKLPFLRKDRREALGLTEKDATEDFFAVYARYGNTQFSYSAQTFAGFTVSNGIFTQTAAPPLLDSTDSFLQEAAFFKREHELPARLYPIQQTGFERYTAVKPERGFSFLTEPFERRLPALSETIGAEQYEDGVFRISQTDLSLFSSCAVKWFLSEVLHISEEDTDSELFNPRYIGIICHKILERLYQKIRDTDGVFCSAHLGEYTAWAENIFDASVHSQTKFRGPLAAPFIESIKKRSLKSIAFVLNFDTEKLDGYRPCNMEEKIRHRSGDILYHGLIDRISCQEGEDRAVILDYKTGAVPSASAYSPDDLNDFQIPMYLFLAEKEIFKQNIEHAFFLDITKGKISFIVNDKNIIPQGRAHSKTREAFEPVVQTFLNTAQAFAAQVQKEDFRKQPEVQWKDCASCAFHAVCRTVFNVDS